MSTHSRSHVLTLVLVLAASGAIALAEGDPAHVKGDAAMDPIKVGPKMYKLVMENERVRVMEVTFNPGDEIAMHWHPDHVAYVREGGKLAITPDGGKATEADLAPGAALWIKSEKHSAKNVGTTKIVVGVIELKEKPTAKAAPAAAAAPAAPAAPAK